MIDPFEPPIAHDARLASTTLTIGGAGPLREHVSAEPARGILAQL